jgi:hypothetical protein
MHGPGAFRDYWPREGCANGVFIPWSDFGAAGPLDRSSAKQTICPALCCLHDWATTSFDEGMMETSGKKQIGNGSFPISTHNAPQSDAVPCQFCCSPLSLLRGLSTALLRTHISQHIPLPVETGDKHWAAMFFATWLIARDQRRLILSRRGVAQRFAEAAVTELLGAAEKLD